jgi:hypothetical protein
MRYKPKGVAALQMILGGFPDTMRVEIDDPGSWAMVAISAISLMKLSLS